MKFKNGLCHTEILLRGAFQLTMWGLENLTVAYTCTNGCLHKFAGYVLLASQNPYPIFIYLWPIIDPIVTFGQILNEIGAVR